MHDCQLTAPSALLTMSIDPAQAVVPTAGRTSAMPWTPTRYPPSMRTAAAAGAPESHRDRQRAARREARRRQGDPHRDRESQGVGIPPRRRADNAAPAGRLVRTRLRPVNALLTDLYQITMLQAYADEGMAAPAVFELFVRKLPAARNFLVAAGLEQVLQYLETFSFSPAEIAWLQRARRVLGEAARPARGHALRRRCRRHAGRHGVLCRRADHPHHGPDRHRRSW